MLTTEYKMAGRTVALMALGVASRNQDNGSPMGSSARLCYEEALTAFMDTDYESAFLRSLLSLRYSVGIRHPDYQDVLTGIGL